MLKVTIQGDAKLIAKLETADRAVRTKLARRAIRPGASIINKAIKQATPRDTEAYGIPRGLLRKSIGVKTGLGGVSIKAGRDGVVGSLIGVRSTFLMPNGDPVTRHAQFVHNGDDRRELRAHPFILDGFNASKDRAATAVMDKASEVVMEALR